MKKVKGLGNKNHSTKQKTTYVIFQVSCEQLLLTSKIHSKHIWLKVLLLKVNMATSNLIINEDKVIIFLEIYIFLDLR